MIYLRIKLRKSSLSITANKSWNNTLNSRLTRRRNSRLTKARSRTLHARIYNAPIRNRPDVLDIANFKNLRLSKAWEIIIINESTSDHNPVLLKFGSIYLEKSKIKTKKI